MMSLNLFCMSVCVAMVTALPAPAILDEEYPLVEPTNMREQVIVPHKRAALVLDRLLVALQKALREDGPNQRFDPDRDGPRTAPLRIANYDTGLQRRGQASGRGRVLRCYFNAITCF
ncbi:uncharacterized protein LOC123696401 isoform X2 [Colias croceus]|uniref:uncharacterized protein LOC123696401 isoform X2 n=1 Tax=Colias crocea TaxID=72248 RepID=UPI001E28004A|nr:uncharacterized protein LOC123696401 isoform X2 [Colias croceus]